MVIKQIVHPKVVSLQDASQQYSNPILLNVSSKDFSYDRKEVKLQNALDLLEAMSSKEEFYDSYPTFYLKDDPGCIQFLNFNYKTWLFDIPVDDGPNWNNETLNKDTGRYINLHKKEIAIGVLTGLVAGTKLKTLANLIFDPSKTEEELKFKGMGFEDFVKMANEDPNNLSDEDWQNLVSQISRRLERQLRLILDIEDVQNFDLITQLDLAKEKQVFTSDEIDKLHNFRKYVRNPILHAKIDKVKKRDINLIIWTANFVKNLEDEEITNID